MTKHFSFAMDAPPKVEPWETLGDRGSKSGQPTQRFKKEITRTGTYYHPTDGWVLRVTPDRQRQWADRMKEMLGAGIEIPLCDDHVVSARTNRGFVVGYEVDGDRGFAVVEAIGEDAIRDVARNGASVYIEPEVLDGEGNNYGEAITHLALTPTPVIGGMGDWIPIAASKQRSTNAGKPLTRAPVVHYYAASLTAQPAGKKGDTMDIRKLLGLAEDANDDAVQKALGDLQGKAKSVETLTNEKAELVKERDSLTAKVAELGKDSADKLDDETAADRAEMVEELVEEKLVKPGIITPAVAASLKPLLIGTDKARPTYMLSRKAGGGKGYIAKQIVDALAANDPVQLSKIRGEKTGEQGTKSLSRQSPAPSDEDKKATESLLASMGAAAGVTAKK